MPLIIFVIALLWMSSASAIELEEEDALRFQSYRGLKGLILSPKLIPPEIGERPAATNDQKILRHAPISNLSETKTSLSLCHDTLPYSHKSLINHAGFDAQLVAAHAASTIEHITIQPHFSGLFGPSISFIRKDFENALRHKTGSKAEIMHNAHVNAPQKQACKNRFKLEFDIEYRAHYDFLDSDKAPLYRTDGIGHARLYMGRHFMGSLGVKIPGFNNLAKDIDLVNIDNAHPIGQDDIFYASQPITVNHLALHGFFTLKPDLYLSAHAGYLEEKFIGLGSEILYRPHNKPWSIGADLWGTMKRASIDGHGFNWHNQNRQFSGFINGWYDMQTRPLTFGLSLGRFLDGDFGGELKTIYKPSSGWRFEGFARYSNEADKSLDNDKETNLTAGLRLTVPLEQIRLDPPNSRATMHIEPFGQDKRQRIHNEYPLYDLTDPWSAQNLNQNWNDVLE